ncbi:MAG: hypothetical protein ACLP1X_26580 [Polyangiaceae bacterium]|jgi:hypothetical protein
MRWYECVAYFFGAFLANTLGGTFQSPVRVTAGEGSGGRDEGAATRQSGGLFS